MSQYDGLEQAIAEIPEGWGLELLTAPYYAPWVARLTYGRGESYEESGSTPAEAIRAAITLIQKGAGQ